MLNITLKDSAETRLQIASKGFTIRGFARQINVSPGYLSEVLSDKKEPSANFAYKIAEGLDQEMEHIFLIKVSANNGHKEVK